MSDLGIDDNEEDNSLETINSVHTTGTLIGSDAVEVREALEVTSSSSCARSRLGENLISSSIEQNPPIPTESVHNSSLNDYSTVGIVQTTSGSLMATINSNVNSVVSVGGRKQSGKKVASKEQRAHFLNDLQKLVFSRRSSQPKCSSFRKSVTATRQNNAGTLFI